MGPMSNLADALITPGMAQRLRITQMGGAINYRNPDRAEHNVRIDVEAARTVLTLGRDVTFVVSDVTFNEAINVGPQSPLFDWLESGGDADWKRLLAEHFRTWFDETDHMPPGSMQHDSVALSAALGMPFVRFRSATVAMDGIGRMSLGENGWPVNLATGVDYEAFNRWLSRSLGVPEPFPD
jgi:pyrimidine-specific ribonucleoside hydrolase